MGIEAAGAQPEPKVHTTQRAQEKPKTESVNLGPKGTEGKQVDFLLIVWAAFFSTLKVNQQTAQVHTDELRTTQQVELDTNNVLASYQYTTISSDKMHSSWDPYFAKVSETNDRVQAQINLVQNQAALEQQTGQAQQTNVNTAIQDAAQAMQQGYGIAKEIMSLTQQISTI